jgi:hypothetical protein
MTTDIGEGPLRYFPDISLLPGMRKRDYCFTDRF